MPGSKFKSLADWLAWQETLHPREIELGLGRVSEVADRVITLPLACPVISVAGTNGKGSVCAYLQSMLTAGGYQTGVYSSPHLCRYNERVQIDGQPVSDAQLLAAFERIDAARGAISLTYFEFGTLAALRIFEQAGVDCAVLEVGLGGRLDAVNIVDADVSVITSIDLDHQAWLGDTRMLIAREKAGIMRPGKAALCGDRDPPPSLIEHASEIGAPLSCLGRDFDWRDDGADWALLDNNQVISGLPWPALAGRAQLDNAALAIKSLGALGEQVPLGVGHYCKGLVSARLPGRIDLRPGRPTWVYDVGHNPAAARELAAWLREHPHPGKTLAVLGMLADKDPLGYTEALAPLVDHWFVAGLTGNRGLSAEALLARLADERKPIPATACDNVAQAVLAAKARAAGDDLILCCGSFHTVGAALGLEL